MLKLIFATNNKHKVDEISGKLPDNIRVMSLAEAGIDINIPEPYDTLEENAKEKSRTILALTGIACFSEDTGLEVDALNGLPGVHSARYAGDNNNSEENVIKLLRNLEKTENRSARFRTIISLQLDGCEYEFEGICNGHIQKEKTGTAGFGYDPVFVPTGSEKSFAEMTMDEKSTYSHRSKAVAEMARFLNNHSS